MYVVNSTVHGTKHDYVCFHQITDNICPFLLYISKTYRNLTFSNSLTFNSVTSFCFSNSWDTFLSFIKSEERESSCSATVFSISARRIKCLLVGTGVGDCFNKSYEMNILSMICRHNWYKYLILQILKNIHLKFDDKYAMKIWDSK